jgi:hypothetical protein
MRIPARIKLQERNAMDFQQSLGTIGQLLVQVLWAVVVLFVGWIIAKIAAVLSRCGPSSSLPVAQELRFEGKAVHSVSGMQEATIV